MVPSRLLLLTWIGRASRVFLTPGIHSTMNSNKRFKKSTVATSNGGNTLRGAIGVARLQEFIRRSPFDTVVLARSS
jgi:hypothetical protein